MLCVCVCVLCVFCCNPVRRSFQHSKDPRVWVDRFYMPTHMYAINKILAMWWKERLSDILGRSLRLYSETSVLRYWWPVLVWVATLRRQMFDDPEQYRHMYTTFCMSILARAEHSVHGEAQVPDIILRMIVNFSEYRAMWGLWPIREAVDEVYQALLEATQWRKHIMTVLPLVHCRARMQLSTRELRQWSQTSRTNNKLAQNIIRHLQMSLGVQIEAAIE
jgi:hypothetical protein